MSGRVATTFPVLSWIWCGAPVIGSQVLPFRYAVDSMVAVLPSVLQSLSMTVSTTSPVALVADHA